MISSFVSFTLYLVLTIRSALGNHVVPKWQTVVPDTGIVVSLTGESSTSWHLHSDDGKYLVDNPRLPSDLLTNLLQAGLIDDPYLDRNFLTQRHVWMGDHARDVQVPSNRTRTWIYTTTFDIPTSTDNAPSFWTWKLILEGIKMGAHVSIDGIRLGTVTNQFLRYQFDVPIPQSSPRLKINPNIRRHTLTITFDPSIPVNGRFTACSGGWDWAPYVKSQDVQGKRDYTFGIVKPIYLVAIQSVAINYVVPKIYYRGPYPRLPMLTPQGDFDLQLDVHIDVVDTSIGRPHTRIKVVTSHHEQWLHLPSPENLRIGGMIISSNLTFRGDEIELWWPNGMGRQPLYDIFVGFEQGLEQAPLMIHQRVGKYKQSNTILP